LLFGLIVLFAAAFVDPLIPKKTEANQALVPTPTAVTPAASHPSRQP